jgi:hypothetical protein
MGGDETNISEKVPRLFQSKGSSRRNLQNDSKDDESLEDYVKIFQYNLQRSKKNKLGS